MIGDRPIHVGVLHLDLQVPGARSLKDRRQAIRSLRDRVLHRFEVTWHEVGDLDAPTRCGIVCTTAGNDARVIRSVLDKVRGFVEESGLVRAAWVDLDVFRWQAPERTWNVETPDE